MLIECASSELIIDRASKSHGEGLKSTHLYGAVNVPY